MQNRRGSSYIRMSIECQLAIKFNAKYWNPEPGQMKLVDKALGIDNEIIYQSI